MVAVVALALAVRVALAVATWHATPSGDEPDYLTLGSNLANGHGYSLSSHAPYAAADWRLPGYPLLVAASDLIGAGRAGVVALNVLLGVVAVVGSMRLANALGGRRVAMVAGLAAALYLPAAGMVPDVLSENLSIPLVVWLVYLAGWTNRSLLTALTAGVLALTRPELLPLAVAAVVVHVVRHQPRRALGAAAVAVTLAFPTAWVVRNSVQVGRFELVDSANRNVTLVLSVEGGQFSAPLYQRGVQGAYRENVRPFDRQDFSSDVQARVRERVSADLPALLRYKAKSLANLPFTPPVRSLSVGVGDDYSLGAAIRNASATKNLPRLGFAVVELAIYAAATAFVVGLVRYRRWAAAAFFAVPPLYLLAVAIPFHAEIRTWMPVGFLLVVPAATWTVQHINRISEDARP